MENNNSVCYVARINEIKEIPGADNIEQAIVGGWSCITKKGKYNNNDLVIIATTDAIIPEKLSDEMGVTSYLRKGGRLRTVKLKKVYSECLIMSPESLGLDSSQLKETCRRKDGVCRPRARLRQTDKLFRSGCHQLRR